MSGVDAKIIALVTPVLESLPREDQPAVVALAERIAAERYRSWAESIGDANARIALLACSDREEEIASRVEAIVPNAAAIQSAAGAAHPDLPRRYAEIFRGHSLDRQFSMQAAAERTGAATWRAFAAECKDPIREVFLGCAILEEENATALESLIASGVAG